MISSCAQDFFHLNEGNLPFIDFHYYYLNLIRISESIV